MALKWGVERAGQDLQICYGEMRASMSLQEAQRFGQKILDVTGLSGTATSQSKTAAPAAGGGKGPKKKSSRPKAARSQ